MRHSVFALEVAARYEPGGRLHSALHAAITGSPVNANLQQKWLFYKQVVSELLVAVPLFHRGCWDYFEDDAKAKASYDQWVAGMVTEEGARPEPSGNDPYRGASRYLTFTMAFLIVHDSPTDFAVRELCNIPQDRLWQRQTFQTILAGLGVLNFASIKSDVAYLIPRDNGWGLTDEDLAHAKFNYLRPLV